MASETIRTREETCLTIAARMSEDDKTITETRQRIPPLKAEIERMVEQVRYFDSEFRRLQTAPPQRVPRSGKWGDALGGALTGLVARGLQSEVAKVGKLKLEHELALKRTELAELETKLEVALANRERMAGEFRQNRCGEIVSPALVFRPL